MKKTQIIQDRLKVSANLIFFKFLNKKLFFNNKKFLITPYTGIICIEVVMKFVVIHFRVDLFPIGKEMRQHYRSISFVTIEIDGIFR